MHITASQLLCFCDSSINWKCQVEDGVYHHNFFENRVWAVVQELEANYTDGKKGYDAAMLDLESRIHQLEALVKSDSAAIAEAQQEFHRVNCVSHKLDTDVKRFMGTDAAAIKEK